MNGEIKVTYCKPGYAWGYSSGNQFLPSSYYSDSDVNGLSELGGERVHKEQTHHMNNIVIGKSLNNRARGKV